MSICCHAITKHTNFDYYNPATFALFFYFHFDADAVAAVSAVAFVSSDLHRLVDTIDENDFVYSIATEAAPVAKP
jgi:hypothetical protein